MSDFNLGTVTAYGYAKDKGYTGTEAEFAELMASYADVAEQAAESATQAAASATTATTKASEAAQSATAAASSKTAAETAQGGAETAAQTATTKAGEATTAATTATNKATEATTAATTATGKATEAAGSATTATTKAGEASTSATNAAASATRAQEILDSIPEDYSQLSDDVSDLKDGLTAIESDVTDLKDDFTSLESRVDAIEEADGLHRYGVSGVGQAAVALTRIWDSVGMTAQVGTDGNNSNVVNNFDDVTPFNRRKCVGDFHIEDGRAVFTVNAYLGDDNYAEDGSMGKFVAVECPRAYYYMKDGILGVSAHQYPGFDQRCTARPRQQCRRYGHRSSRRKLCFRKCDHYRYDAALHRIHAGCFQCKCDHYRSHARSG